MRAKTYSRCSRVCETTATLAVLVLALAGCRGTVQGSKIQPAQVNAITKGVTTRAEVEAAFGPPTSSTLMPDGRRMLMFMHHETTPTTASYIPFVSSFGGAGTDMRKQSLQVIVGPDNIVQDYDFSDTTASTRSSVFGGTEMKQAPTPGGGN